MALHSPPRAALSPPGDHKNKTVRMRSAGTCKPWTVIDVIRSVLTSLVHWGCQSRRIQGGCWHCTRRSRRVQRWWWWVTGQYCLASTSTTTAPDAGDNMTIPSGPMGATVVTTLHRGPPRSSHTDINNYRNYIRTLRTLMSDVWLLNNFNLTIISSNAL